jgi:hypothetical protein
MKCMLRFLLLFIITTTSIFLISYGLDLVSGNQIQDRKFTCILYMILPLIGIFIEHWWRLGFESGYCPLVYLWFSFHLYVVHLARSKLHTFHCHIVWKRNYKLYIVREGENNPLFYNEFNVINHFLWGVFVRLGPQTSMWIT